MLRTEFIYFYSQNLSGKNYLKDNIELTDENK